MPVQNWYVSFAMNRLRQRFRSVDYLNLPDFLFKSSQLQVNAWLQVTALEAAWTTSKSKRSNCTSCIIRSRKIISHTKGDGSKSIIVSPLKSGFRFNRKQLCAAQQSDNLSQLPKLLDSNEPKYKLKLTKFYTELRCTKLREAAVQEIKVRNR